MVSINVTKKLTNMLETHWGIYMGGRNGPATEETLEFENT